MTDPKRNAELKVTPRNKSKVRYKPTAEELEELYSETQKLVKFHENPEKGKAGAKHFLCDDVTQKTGDDILMITSLRMSNVSDIVIGERIGVAQPNIAMLERTYPRAFAAAEAYLFRQMELKYQANLWRVRSAISELAPKMVIVLSDLAQNPETPPNIRRSAAVDVLNLSGVGYSRQTKGGKDNTVYKTAVLNIRNTFGDDPRFSIVDPTSPGSETIEDAEFTEDNS